MLAQPVAQVLAVLAVAVLCFALGTFRGSWRVWLIGYALTVVALALGFAGVYNAHRPGALPADAVAATAGARPPAGSPTVRNGGPPPSGRARSSGIGEPRR